MAAPKCFYYLVSSVEDLEPSQIRDAILEAWGFDQFTDISVGRFEMPSVIKVVSEEDGEMPMTIFSSISEEGGGGGEAA